MPYDPDEMVAYKGKMFTKEVLFLRVRGLGWNETLFGDLTDSQIAEVLDGKKTPAMLGKTAPAAPIVDPQQMLESTVGSDPDIMGAASPAAPSPAPNPAAPPQVSPRVAAIVSPATHLKPANPMLQAQAPASPVMGAPPVVNPTFQPAPEIKPPRISSQNALSILRAAAALIKSGMAEEAGNLLRTSDLVPVFSTLYSDQAAKLFPERERATDDCKRGGILLSVEHENGYIHFVTTAGTITVTGSNLKIEQ
jgi:hypothetical protein